MAERGKSDRVAGIFQHAAGQWLAEGRQAQDRERFFECAAGSSLNSPEAGTFSATQPSVASS